MLVVQLGVVVWSARVGLELLQMVAHSIIQLSLSKMATATTNRSRLHVLRRLAALVTELERSRRLCTNTRLREPHLLLHAHLGLTIHILLLLLTVLLVAGLPLALLSRGRLMVLHSCLR